MSDAPNIVVIGAGPGGYTAAIYAAQRGARVALVDPGRVGGTCLNWGCIPTKAMAHDAELYRALASGDYAAQCDGGLRVDAERLLARRAEVVESLVSGVERLLEMHGVARYVGRGRLVRPGLVEVRGEGEAEEIEARHVIIATGAVPSVPPIPGADLDGVVTSDGLLALDRVPESLVVIGGSIVGTEFASIYAALGARVEILEKFGFLPAVEEQLAGRYRSLLRRAGVPVATEVDVEEIARANGGLRVTYTPRAGRHQGERLTADGEVVLMATGRRPYTEGLGLEEAGVRTDQGAVVVDEHLATNVPGVWAIGDCTGGWMLAHVASYEAEVAVDNILGHERAADHTVVPNCVYTIPEIASVGLTEAAAKEAGLKVRVTRFPFGASGRALALGETEGQVRMVCEADSEGLGGRILGVHIMGPRASDVIAEAALAIRLGATAEDLAHTMHQHPTIPEALMEAAMAQRGGAIHYYERAGRGRRDDA